MWAFAITWRPSSINFSHLNLLRCVWSINKHGCHRQLLFQIGQFLKKSSSLKLLCQMNRNLVGSILGRSFIKIANLVPIHWQTWPPKAILVSDWLISKKNLLSETALPNELKLGRKHPWKVIYKEYSFSSDPSINMATTGHSCFWLVDF